MIARIAIELTDRLTPLLQSVDELLRDAAGVLQRIDEERDLALVAKAALLTIAFGAGIFGATLGFYRGGVQVLYAGIKLPLVLLLTTAVCAPALSALNAAVGRHSSLRRDLALVLCSLELVSLVLAALAPLVLLAVAFDISYHHLLLLTVGCCGLAGLVGLGLLARGLWRGGRRGLVTVGLLLLMVFSAVGAQLAWTARPFLVRPRSPEVPFVRAVESSFFEAVRTSSRSAQGYYTRDSAPLPGEAEQTEPSEQAECCVEESWELP